MKTFLLSLLAFGLTLSLTQCESDPDLTKGYSTSIQNIVPPALLDTLKKKGMTIHEGQVPPNLEGIFHESPNVLMSQAFPGDYPVGELFADYHYRFYGQNTKTGAINLDYKSLPEEDSLDFTVGKGAYVAGAGNFFTLFAESKGESYRIPYSSLTVISGEITPQGIRNFQLGFIMKSKDGDLDNVQILGVGQGRVFKDEDGITERIGQYRLAVLPSGKSLSTKHSIVSQKRP